MKPRNLEFFLSTVAGNVFSHAAPHGLRDTIPFHTHIRTGSNLTRSLGDPLPGFLSLPTQFYPDAICLRQAGFLRLTQISKKCWRKLGNPEASALTSGGCSRIWEGPCRDRNAGTL